MGDLAYDIFTNQELLIYICSFTREEYNKKMCKQIYNAWIFMPFGYTTRIDEKQMDLYRKWSDLISKADNNYFPAVIVGNIKTRNPDHTKYSNGVYPNGMLWCFDGRRLMSLKHREDGLVSWRNLKS